MATGTSIYGLQTLTANGTAPGQIWSVAMTNTPLPPAYRVGYFYFYMFLTAAPNQCYLLDSGILYRPGMLRKAQVALLSNAYAYRLDAVWNVAGIVWNANIA